MKLAVSSSGKDLNSQLDPRFGRCAYFIVVDTENMSFDAIQNDSAALGGGAGIQSAQTLASKKIHAVITGNCGPNAVQALSAAGIELHMGQAGTIREVVERFMAGELTVSDQPNVSSHYGMGGGAGAGLGGGMGRGMRRGLGRGGGFGFTGRLSSSQQKSPQVSEHEDEELEALKEKAKNLNGQLANIMSRINELEKQE
jgi:predicted Fe-Mo cluster-binding NifX family protein